MARIKKARNFQLRVGRMDVFRSVLGNVWKA